MEINDKLNLKAVDKLIKEIIKWVIVLYYYFWFDDEKEAIRVKYGFKMQLRGLVGD